MVFNFINTQGMETSQADIQHSTTHTIVKFVALNQLSKEDD